MQNRTVGQSDPSSRKDVVLAASDLYCSICDARPCYMLATASLAVFQEQLTENEGDNLIGAVRYVQNLERLQHCLTRHHEVAVETWQLNNHFQISENAKRELERQGIDVAQLMVNVQNGTKNGDPPTHKRI